MEKEQCNDMKQKVVKITESQFKSMLDESHSGINEELMNDAKNITVC